MSRAWRLCVCATEHLRVGREAAMNRRSVQRRAVTTAALIGAASIAALVAPAGVRAAGHATFGSGPIVGARASEPVVVTGAQIPQWSHLAPQGTPAPYPSG